MGRSERLGTPEQSRDAWAMMLRPDSGLQRRFWWSAWGCQGLPHLERISKSSVVCVHVCVCVCVLGEMTRPLFKQPSLCPPPPSIDVFVSR